MVLYDLSVFCDNALTKLEDCYTNRTSLCKLSDMGEKGESLVGTIDLSTPSSVTTVRSKAYCIVSKKPRM